MLSIMIIIIGNGIPPGKGMNSSALLPDMGKY